MSAKNLIIELNKNKFMGKTSVYHKKRIHFTLSEIARRRNIVWIQIKDKNKANKVIYQFPTKQLGKYL